MKRLKHFGLLGLLTAAFVLVACSGTDEEPQEFAPRALTVLVGGGRGTTSLNAYFPRRLEVRAGDTVNWQMNGELDDPHTVTFAPDLSQIVDIIPRPGGDSFESIFNPQLLAPSRREGETTETYQPGGYFNSGIMFAYVPSEGVPMIEKFALKFPEPGVYDYICGIHEFHRGQIVVKPADDPDLPNQREVDEQAAKEMEPLLRIPEPIQGVLASGGPTTPPDKEPAPNGTDHWFVAAGIGTPEAEVLEFFPRDITVQRGDRVTWMATRFHAVVLNPGGAFPPFYVSEPRVSGLPLVKAASEIIYESRPEPTDQFNGEGFWSSGLMGYGARPGGLGFSLVFTETGKYNYMCPIHQGMVGTVTVVEDAGESDAGGQ